MHFVANLITLLKSLPTTSIYSTIHSSIIIPLLTLIASFLSFDQVHPKHKLTRNKYITHMLKRTRLWYISSIRKRLLDWVTRLDSPLWMCHRTDCQMPQFVEVTNTKTFWLIAKLLDVKDLKYLLPNIFRQNYCFDYFIQAMCLFSFARRRLFIFQTDKVTSRTVAQQT